MWAVVWAVRFHVGDWGQLSGLYRVLWLVVAVAAGAAVYLAMQLIFGLRLRHLREV
jgi:peptidoglycan biosynthesis protein MviN/MurJ (putative lipid II flippase)